MRPSLVALAMLAMAARAYAGPNAPLAEALFREASDAFKEGRVAEACAKFAESQRLDPQRGTLANLARCHEREGKVATAWSDYIALRELARQASDEPRAAYAQKRIDELEPTLPKIKLSVEPNLTIKEVKLDGTAIGQAAIGTTFPVDPGAHKVEATSADGRTWTQTFESPERGTTSVVLRSPPPEVHPPPPPPPSPSRTWQKPVAVGAMIGGGAGLVTGSILGILVVAKKADITGNCVDKLCNTTGFAAQKDAWALSWGSTIAFIAGGVLEAAGVVLFFTAPKQEAHVAVRVLPNGAMLEGTW